MIPTFNTLLVIQALFGAPIYLIAGALQGIWLHSRGQSVAAVISTALLTTALTVVAGALIWRHYLLGTEIMLWNTVNLPALIATAIVFPTITVLITVAFTGFGRRG